MVAFVILLYGGHNYGKFLDSTQGDFEVKEEGQKHLVPL
jgi:hypothetical protein